MAQTSISKSRFPFDRWRGWFTFQNAAHAAFCEVISSAAWFTNGVVTFNPMARWCMNRERRHLGMHRCSAGQVTLRWRLGSYVNHNPVLSADGTGLSSTDPSQHFVTAKDLMQVEQRSLRRTPLCPQVQRLNPRPPSRTGAASLSIS